MCGRQLRLIGKRRPCLIVNIHWRLRRDKFQIGTIKCVNSADITPVGFTVLKGTHKLMGLDMISPIKNFWNNIAPKIMARACILCIRTKMLFRYLAWHVNSHAGEVGWIPGWVLELRFSAKLTTVFICRYAELTSSFNNWDG